MRGVTAQSPAVKSNPVGLCKVTPNPQHPKNTCCSSKCDGDGFYRGLKSILRAAESGVNEREMTISFKGNCTSR